MRSSATYFLAAITGVLLMSSCTMGDKGSEKIPDSVSIDTTITPAQPAQAPSDTTLIDSLQTDTTKAGVKP